MDRLLAYNLIEEVHTGSVRIWRGVKNGRPPSCILKVIPGSRPCQAGRLKYEFNIMDRISGAYVPRPLDLISTGNRLALVMSDIHGFPLDRLFPGTMATESLFLDLAAKMVRAVMQIHSSGIIHTRLSLSHIIFNRQTNNLHIIDFSHALDADTIPQDCVQNSIPEKFTACMAPEQTGRASFPIDLRTDLYALGVIFYKLLSGRFPFAPDPSDPSKFTHALLANTPEKLDNKKISPATAEVVNILLSKSADNRFASAKDLATALKACPGSAEKTHCFVSHTGPPAGMPGFSTSEILCGRSGAKQIILDAWASVPGRKQIISVTGSAGVGKTSLINSLDTPELRKQGRFIRGKFDQAGIQRPYGAISDAFQMIIHEILGQDQTRFNYWKNKLGRALGTNARLIADVIPGLEKILGPMPAVPELSPLAEKNRFAYLFKTFVNALTKKEAPLFIFMDDLQWADPASMEIISSICQLDDLRNFLFVSACRSDEMAKDHPWFLVQEELGNSDTPLEIIELPALTQAQTSRMVATVLDTSFDDTRTLGEMIFKKTGGNPLSVREFLNAIFKKDLLKYKPAGWFWDLDTINTLPVNESAAGMIAERIKDVRGQTAKFLTGGACLGSPFDIRDLAIGESVAFEDVVQHLSMAREAGIIIPFTPARTDPVPFIGPVVELPDDSVPALPDTPHYYAFAHDNIQEAVLSLVTGPKGRAHREKLARRLYNHYFPEFPGNSLFLTANLVNAVSFNDPDDQLAFARLNNHAGSFALEQAAYDSALNYFSAGITLLNAHARTKRPMNIWEAFQDFTLSLYQGAAQAAFLLGRYQEFDTYFEAVDLNIKDPVLKVRVYEIKTCSLYARNMMDQAVDTAFHFTGLLGVRFPKNPKSFHILSGVIYTSLRLFPFSTKRLAKRKKMTDPRVIAVMQVMACVTLPAFYARPNLMPLIILKSIQLSLKYGNADASAFGYAGYGMILCGFLNRMETGKAFGELADSLVLSGNLKTIEARTTATIQCFITFWHTHLNKALPALLRGHKTGLETGDHLFGSLCAASYCSFSFYTGIPLKKLLARINRFRNLFAQIKQDVILNDINMLCQTVCCLSGMAPCPWHLTGEVYNIESSTPKLEAANDNLGLFTQFFLSMELCLVFDKYGDALAYAGKAQKYLEIARSMPEMAYFLFYDSIARINRIQWAGPQTRKAWLKKIKKNQKQLKKWAGSAPMNIRHKYDLVQAMVSARTGRPDRARDEFESAVTGAGRYGYIQDQAMACEYAGRFFLSMDDETFARKYLSMAHELYFQWGALAKTAYMERRYPPELLKDSGVIPPDSPGTRQMDNFGKTPDPELIAAHHTDLHAVLKASKTIAEETRLDQVLEKLLRFILKSSGARKAFIILYESSVLKIQAFACADPFRIKVLQDLAFDPGNNYLPATLIHFVMRSDQPVILENAPGSNLFSNDRYIISHMPLSVLCIPIFNKNMKTGILYLENDLIKGLFTKERLKILDILLAQAVASMENSKLYGALDREKEQKDAAFNEISVQKKMLQNMSAELAMAEERERKAIADDLHDSVTQTLALSVIKLEKLNHTLEQPQNTEHVTSVRRHMEQALAEIRSLTFQLSPKILYDFGLAAALDWLADDLNAKYDLEVIFVNRLKNAPELDETANITIYRAVRELLINIVKHADTDLAFVQLDGDENTRILTVKDQGTGFTKPGTPVSNGAARGGFGLLSIQERIQALNGSMRIASGPGLGTKITITLPVTS